MPAPDAPQADDVSTAASPWAAIDPEPTNLIAVWPHEAPPAREAVLASLAGHHGAEPVVHRTDDAPEQGWWMAVSTPADAPPRVWWTEPARGGGPPETAAARWVLGVEAPLDDVDPLAAYRDLGRSLLAAASGTPAVLDVNTEAWRRADLLRSLLDDPDDIEPPLDLLWTVRLATGGGPGGELAWPHTRGLARCGRPELEMLEVPLAAAEAAAAFLHDVAALIVEAGAPPAGAPFEVGPDIAITLRDRETIAPRMPAGAPGRDGDDGGGPRAVVCDPTPRGRYTTAWVWPQTAVERLAAGAGALFRSRRAAARQSRAARARWSTFVAAFARRGAEDAARFEVLAQVEVGAPARRAHLWFRPERVDAAGAAGTLLSPLEPGASPAPHPADGIPLDRISDWRVVAPAGIYGPDDAAALRAWAEGAP